MTNKLVVIINSLRVPKIKKILLYGMKFLVSNYSWLQNPWLGGYRSLCPQLNLLNHPLPPKQIPGYAAVNHICYCLPHLTLTYLCEAAVFCQFTGSVKQSFVYVCSQLLSHCGTADMAFFTTYYLHNLEKWRLEVIQCLNVNLYCRRQLPS